MTKSIVVAVPRIEPHRPPPGPAIVASVCAGLGHEVKVLDLNIKLFHYCSNSKDSYESFDPIWDGFTDPTESQIETLQKFIDHWQQAIAQENCDYVLISVFGVSGKFFAERFLQGLKGRIKARVVAGGNAINSMSLLDPNKTYGHKLRTQGLIDDYIIGEGEEALKHYFTNGHGPGINGQEPVQINDLDPLPKPDYGYFDLDEYDYLYPGKRDVYITGSRGCVRRCSYCDIERYWPKYRYRSGQDIAEEIIKNYERHHITRFYFTDSLINGSNRVFMDMCDRLANYSFPERIHWDAQFIFRTRNSTPEGYFDLIASSGAELLYVGLETGSDRIRAEMGKKFTNEDIEWQLEQCSQFGIKIMPLMFTGYITETIEDHQETLEIFARWQKFVADGTIPAIELGSDLAILPGSPVSRMIESHGLRFLFDKQGEPMGRLWISDVNPNLTIVERIRRKLEIHETAMRYNWPIWRQQSRLNDLKQQIIKHELWKPKRHFSIQIASESQ